MAVTYSTIPCTTFSRDGTARDYLRTNLCPVANFFTQRNYFPERVNKTEYPWRNGFRGGECSNAPDTGPNYDFQVACKAHDYCYDLIRARFPAPYARVSRLDCDNLFGEDIQTHCNSRAIFVRESCHITGSAFVTVVVANSVRQGYGVP